MVYLLDEGSVFDAPIDKVWKYLQSPDHQHPSSKLISREISGNVVVLTGERTMMGKTVRGKIRNTVYPPFGFLQEHLEGPTAGSKAFVYYIPKGDKTGITIVGDFHIEGMNDQQTRDAILAQSQVTFDEDNTNLKKIE